MAEGKLASAQIDSLEMQRLDLKRTLLADRTEHLDIKSPIDGIVVSSDLQRCEGVPVTIGQVLYEVAPLEQMVAEVAIPDEEVSHVRAAMPVKICLDSQPGAFRGQLEKIHPLRHGAGKGQRLPRRSATGQPRFDASTGYEGAGEDHHDAAPHRLDSFPQALGLAAHRVGMVT